MTGVAPIPYYIQQKGAERKTPTAGKRGMGFSKFIFKANAYYLLLTGFHSAACRNLYFLWYSYTWRHLGSKKLNFKFLAGTCTAH